MRGLGAKTVEIRKAIREILETIHPASVRAVCYKLFVRKLIDSMEKNNTNIVGRNLVAMREEGMVPWHWVVDESREIEKQITWPNLARHFDHLTYFRDHWQDQLERVILVSEKGTVRGTIEPVLDELKVPLLVGHGYNSATLAHDLADLSRKHKRPLWILYIGDHDPSGMQMSEVDLPERLTRYGGVFHPIVRVAVTTDEVPTLSTFSANDNQNPNRAWYTRHYGVRRT